MRLISNTKTEKYHEIEIERNYFLFKVKTKYRLVKGCVFIYKDINRYYNTSRTEHIDVHHLFDVIL